MTVAFSPRVATLDERYERRDGTIYLTGIQALVRMLLDRARHDRERGTRTACYVSGYEGSPLGGYDLELARHRGLLGEYEIRHQPGLNEELAATAVSGTQLAGRVGDATCDGVTGVWYGKAPGLDRATDALRHANMIGAAPAGGAVALVGDDPAAQVLHLALFLGNGTRRPRHTDLLPRRPGRGPGPRPAASTRLPDRATPGSAWWPPARLTWTSARPSPRSG